MKKIIDIYAQDIKDIFTNYAMLIVVISLCILPSLYAWFNIKASWDPYGNTGNIPVAVVNNDKGNTLRNKYINIGDELINKLKKNNKLGWKFVSESEAEKGVKDGTYYASIEIPSNFSKDLTSLITSNVKRGEIIYTVNEKINAVAPKITDKGASSIQLQVNQTVVETVSQVLFETFNTIGIELEKQLPKLSNIENTLIEVQDKFPDIYNTVDLASDGISKIETFSKDLKNDLPMLKETLENSKSLSSDVKDFLQSSKGSINDILPIINNDVSLINDISSSIVDISNSLLDLASNNSDKLVNLIDNLSVKLDGLSNTNKSLVNFLNKLNAIKPNDSLTNTINKLSGLNSKISTAISDLSTAKNQISSGQIPSTGIINNINQVSKDIQSITSNIYNNFDSNISNPINNIFDKGFTVADNIIQVLQSAEAKLPQANDILDTVLKLSDKGDKGIQFAKENLPKAEKIVNELVSAMEKVNKDNNLNDLINLLKNDVISEKNFLKEPVTITEHKIYPIKNYGSGMTPFYTVLALWVGLLLLSSLLSAEVHGEYKPFQIYFGRGLTFGTISIIQSLIVSMGDIYILGVSPKNPVLLILGSVFISVVFTSIIYSLVSIFGNIGKALGIVLLVVQLAGSGGTFPIQVTPKFFQIVNPYLPFTYAISILREAIGGVYQPVLTKDIIVLCIYIVIFLVLALLLKRPLNKLFEGFTNKFASSRLSEH